MNPDECNNELKPCPFCGSRNVGFNHGWVECQNTRCVALGPGTIEVPEEIAIAAWNSRTESKPVTREGGGRWISEETLKRCLVLAEDPRNEYEETNEIVRQLRGAPQSPVVPGVLSIQELVDYAVKKRMERNGGWIYGDEELALINSVHDIHAHLLATIPQSAPVVPGVEELDQLYHEIMLATDANASTVIGWANRIKAIHAHLLATGGRESREDRYRQALERAIDEWAMPFSVLDDIVNRETVFSTFNQLADDLKCTLRKALATTGPKEPS